jgi:hypothetical protein
MKRASTGTNRHPAGDEEKIQRIVTVFAGQDKQIDGTGPWVSEKKVMRHFFCFFLI